MLDVRSLSFSYPNGRVALTNLSISVEPGTLVVVLGGNGSGKTTLVRCVSHMLRASSGEIRVNGRDTIGLEGERLRRARLDLAVVSQHAALVKRRGVIENIATGALGRHPGLRTAVGMLPRCELEAAHERLREVGLSEISGQRADTLSGGQAQRVAIARALAQRPRVLLADEPVASLDPEASQDIMRLLRSLAHEQNLAVLCVLHQLDLAYAFADRLVGIRHGRIAFDLGSSDVSPDTVRELYLSNAA